MLAAMLALVASIVAFTVSLARAKIARLMAGLALVVSIGPIGLGSIGRAVGRAKVDRAIGYAAPEYKERIRVEGYSEADGCVTIGAVLGTVPFVASLIALGLALRPAKEPSGPV
jgi:hypothetical protein